MHLMTQINLHKIYITHKHITNLHGKYPKNLQFKIKKYHAPICKAQYN